MFSVLIKSTMAWHVCTVFNSIIQNISGLQQELVENEQKSKWSFDHFPKYNLNSCVRKHPHSYSLKYIIIGIMWWMNYFANTRRLGDDLWQFYTTFLQSWWNSFLFPTGCLNHHVYTWQRVHSGCLHIKNGSVNWFHCCPVTYLMSGSRFFFPISKTCLVKSCINDHDFLLLLYNKDFKVNMYILTHQRICKE